ncbi:MAG TPA: hypothetical protein VMI75_26315 [Polyangiaceae bacterium]|nr:hypothetical protein [Polyangiaceae bacterium]
MQARRAGLGAFVVLCTLGGCGGAIDPSPGNPGHAPDPPAPAPASPTLTVLASGLGAPAYIAVRAGQLYWTENEVDSDTGHVMTMPTLGGTPVTLATSVSAGHLALAANDVYFTQRVDRIGIPGQQAPIMAVPLEGGAMRMVAASPWAFGLAVDESELYYAGAVDGASSAQQTALVHMPVAGGAPCPVVSSLFLGDIAVGSTGVFWADISGVLYRWARDGSGTTALASAPPSSGEYFGIGMGGIAVGDATVYWGVAGALMATPVDGGATTTLGSTPHTWIADLAVDDDAVYWTAIPDDLSEGRGAVMKVPRAGGSVTTLATGLSFPFGIAVDAAGVYVTDPVDRTVERVAPK